MNRVLLEKLTVLRLLNKFPALNGTRLMQRKIKRFLTTVVSFIHCTAKAARPRSWGSITGKGKKSISSPQRPGRHWDAISFLSDRYRELFPRGKAVKAILTTRSHLESRLNKRTASMPQCLVKNEGIFTLKTSLFTI